jgi:hypothetical protein
LDFLHCDGLGREIDWLRLTREASVEEVCSYLITFHSYARTEVVAWMLDSTTDRPERCLRIFLDAGNMCDAPWGYRTMIANALRLARARVDLPKVLEPDERRFYDALPAIVPVWRGCQRGRERGLHWTTDRAVAEAFARGKRCRNGDPTLACAEIPKRHIFGIFLSRSEQEIALDPRRLRKLQSRGLDQTNVAA